MEFSSSSVPRFPRMHYILELAMKRVQTTEVKLYVQVQTPAYDEGRVLVLVIRTLATAVAGARYVCTQESCERDVPLMVCANKVDLRAQLEADGRRCVAYEDGHRLARVRTSSRSHHTRHSISHSTLISLHYTRGVLHQLIVNSIILL